MVTDMWFILSYFADDTSSFIIVENPHTAAEHLNLDLENNYDLGKSRLVSFNPKKQFLLISR